MKPIFVGARQTLLALLALASTPLLPTAHADTFGSGGNLFEIQFVPIGNPGNPADTTGMPNPAGRVDYSYRIGKFEISRSMIEKANSEGGLGITLADMTTFGGNGSDKPATGVTWFEAARFVNWLNTSSGHMPAYKFDNGPNFQLWQPGDVGYDPNNLFRNTRAFYFLPSVDEWYKAAYYDPATGSYFDYPIGGNGPPTAVASGTAPNTAVFNQSLSSGPANIMLAGALSPYGTMAQGGNVGEWEETELDLTNNSIGDFRGARGGGWEDLSSALSVTFRSGGSPSNPLGAGLRIASIVPEPRSAITFAACFLGLLGRRFRSLEKQ